MNVEPLPTREDTGLLAARAIPWQRLGPPALPTASEMTRLGQRANFVHAAEDFLGTVSYRLLEDEEKS